MKLRVVGWVSSYAEIERGEVSWAARNAIIDELRKHGYVFPGTVHGDSGTVPVLNNGRKYLFSTRGWGDIMAEAQGHTGSMDYTMYDLPMSSKALNLPDTDLNEFEFVSPEEMDEIIQFDEDDIESGYRDYVRSTAKVLKPETDLNERIELSVTREVLDRALNEGQITLPVLPELRYIDTGDTLAAVCGDTMEEFTVVDVVRKRDLSETKLQQLIDATYDFRDREKAMRAQDEIDSAKMILSIKLRKEMK